MTRKVSAVAVPSVAAPVAASPSLEEGTLNAALIECVRAAGGSKRIGPMLWPEKPLESAQRMLLDCLNEDRPAHLKPEQVLLVLRAARDAGYHDGVNWVLAHLGYVVTTPMQPQDEVAELQRKFIAAQSQMADMMRTMQALAQKVGGQ